MKKINEMERMERQQNWEKNNINGQVASRLLEIWQSKWEKVFANMNNPNGFTYQGRRMWVWLKVVWVKVGDVADESDYAYTVKLWDMAVCRDFNDVITAMAEEEGFKLAIWDTISLKDATTSLWGEYQIINDMITFIEECWLRDKEKLEEILESITDDLYRETPAFTPYVRDGGLYLRAWTEEITIDLVNKGPEFIRNMNNIKKYFEENMSTIKEKINNAVNEEKRQNEELIKQQQKEAEDLENQL